MKFKTSQIILLFVLITSGLLAQSPEAFKYQAVVRDANGSILADQSVRIQISILQGSTSGANVYQESFPVTTNSYGLVNLEIGRGMVTNGSFSTINWGSGPYFVETSLDVTGGTNYTLMGTSQLLSVPYALHANTAGNTLWKESGNSGNIYYNDGNVGIGNENPEGVLEVIGNGQANNSFDNTRQIIAKNQGNTTNHTYMSAVNASNLGITTSIFEGKVSRGSLANPQQVQSGDRIMFLSGVPYMNNGWRTPVGIEMFVGQNPGSSSYPAYMTFSTTDNGQTAKTERMRITESGNVGIGTDRPLGVFEVVGRGLANNSFDNTRQIIAKNQGSTTNHTYMSAVNASNLGITTSIFEGKVSRGSLTNPQQVQSGDRIMFLSGVPYVDNGWRTPVGVEMFVGQNPGSGSYPAYMTFSTTDTGQTAKTERLRITTDGNVGISTTNPKAKLQVTDGDIYIEDVNKGVIMKSPNGNCWRMTIDNSGTQIITAITCPQ